MKTALLSLLAVMALGLSAVAEDLKFIMMTVATEWDDGAASPVGFVEQVVSETPEGYVVAGNGRKYVVPKTSAIVVSPAQAAVALLAERQKLYAQLDAAVPPSAQPQAPARSAQYNGRPLPRNWIDPKQADQNFYNQQIVNELRRIQSLPK